MNISIVPYVSAYGKWQWGGNRHYNDKGIRSLDTMLFASFVLGLWFPVFSRVVSHSAVKRFLGNTPFGVLYIFYPFANEPEKALRFHFPGEPDCSAITFR